MKKKGIPEPEYKFATHHIVAAGSRFAKKTRLILQKFDIDINDAVNGVFLSTQKNLNIKTTYHPSMHTKMYYSKVEKLLLKANSREEVIKVLNTISTELLNGTFL